MFRLSRFKKSSSAAFVIIAALLFVLTLPAFSSLSEADESQSKEFAPISEVFKNWTKPGKAKTILRIKSVSSQDAVYSVPVYNGLIPSPVDRSKLWEDPPIPASNNQSGIIRVKAASQYSLKTQSRLPAIRNQNPWGTCWAHASLASIESNAITRYQDTSINLSEFHLAYFVYGDTRAGKSFGKYDNDDILDQGGNIDQAIAFLSRAGTVNEGTLSYPSSYSYTPPSGFPENYTSSGYFLKDAYTLGPSGATAPTAVTINTIKNLVTQNGAVQISYYAGSGAYSPNSSVYVYYDKTYGTVTNHAVCIVGWDDNFNKSNFANTRSGTPSSNGAWLVRNSWGASWGDSGYFWMPYEQPIAEISQLLTEKVDKSLKTYCYDELGATGGYSTWTWGANIFQANDDEVLQYAGFYTRANNTSYEVYVYDLGTTKIDSPRSGTLIASESGTCTYAGYHTVDFTSLSAKIAKGHYFSVVIKVSSGVPLEMAINWANGNPYSNPVCNAGESFASYNGINWQAENEYNVCAKVFTIKDSSSSSNINNLALSGNFANGTVGTSYSSSITATGGSGSYTFTQSGTLPAGLSFSYSGSTATISGTPTSAGNYNNVIITVTDSNNSTYTQIFAIKILSASTGSLVINGSFLQGYNKQDSTGMNTFYYSTVTVTGGTAPYTWTQTSGQVPSGLTLAFDGDTAELSGIPTSSQNCSFTLNVTDSAGNSVSKTFNVIISAQYPETVLIINGSFAAGTVGTSYTESSGSVSVSGGTSPYVLYTIGNVPPGLALSRNSAGNALILTGIPTTPGSYTFKIYAADANNYPGSKEFTVTIEASSSSSLAVTGTLPNGTVNTLYTGSLSVSGGNAPYTWTLASGTLPPGLSISSSGTTGTISGTPTTAGSYTFTIQVRDSRGIIAAKSFTVVISAPAITITGTLANGSAGAEYAGILSASGGTSPYTWELTSGSLPTGLTLNAETGRITGIPRTAGTYTFKIQATDTDGLTASRTFTIKITGTIIALTINGSLAAAGYQGSSYSGELRAGGGISPYTWTYSGNLPDGMNFTSSGNVAKVTGIPTETGTFTFTINLSDAIGTTISKLYTLTIQARQSLNINGTFTNSTKGASYSKSAAVTGGTAPYTWSYSGRLPSGLRMALSNTRGTGVILSGTTSTAGTYTFTLKVRDKNGLTGEKMFTVNVTQLALSGTFANGAAKLAYSSRITASGGITPYRWSYSGKLPTGLRLSYSGSNVTLSGTPTAGGKFTFTLKLTDSNNVSISKTFTVNITAAPTLTGTFNASASAGKSYTGKATVTGGTSPYTWTYSGNLPAGLRFTSSGRTATVSGTPTTAGTFTFTIKVTDANGISVSKSFTVKVTKPAISGTFKTTGTLNKSYSSSVRASGGTTPYKWVKSSGSLPTGLKLTYSGATAKLTGKPTRAGTFKFALRVTDKNGGTDTESFTITIPSTASNNRSSSTSSPTISGTLSSGTVKKYYSKTVKVTGGTASYTWKRSSGKLPTGLKLSSSGSTAKIYGTPKKAGTFSFTLKVTDKNKKTATKKFTVKIAKDSTTTTTTAKAKASGITESSAVIAVPVNNYSSSNNNYIHINKIALDIVKDKNVIARGSERDNDLITVKAGKPLTFIIGSYTDTEGNEADLHDLRVFIDFEYDEDIIISESESGAWTFTIPGDLVEGDFTVSVKGVYNGLEAESEELYIEAK